MSPFIMGDPGDASIALLILNPLLVMGCFGGGILLTSISDGVTREVANKAAVGAWHRANQRARARAVEGS